MFLSGFDYITNNISKKEKKRKFDMFIVLLQTSSMDGDHLISIKKQGH